MIQNILTGIQAYAAAFKLISQLSLWKYFAIPVFISLLTALSIGFTSWGLSDNIGGFISRIWFWDWGKETFRTISDILGGLAIIALGLILYKHIIMALSAPFMSPVSEKIEHHLLGANHQHRNTSSASQLWRGIRINIRNLLLELMLTIPLLLLSFIPLLNIVTTVLIFLIQAYYAGFGNMDYTLERHLTYAKSIQFVKQNRGIAIGNGIIFMLLLFIPVIGILLVLPLSVTASTQETVRLINKQTSLKS